MKLKGIAPVIVGTFIGSVILFNNSSEEFKNTVYIGSSVALGLFTIGVISYLYYIYYNTPDAQDARWKREDEAEAKAKRRASEDSPETIIDILNSEKIVSHKPGKEGEIRYLNNVTGAYETYETRLEHKKKK